MDLHPIIEREFQYALRRKWNWRARLGYALVGGLITLQFALFNAPVGTRRMGESLFPFLILLGCLGAVGETLRLTVDLFASERRNSTLGLLFLTGMSAGEVFLTKLFGGTLLAFYSLLSLLPFFAVPFLTGGVPVSHFIAAVCLLPNLLFFTLALSTLGSVLCDDDSAAILVAAGLGALLCLVPAALHFVANPFPGTGGVAGEWLLLSPAYGPWTVFSGLTTASLHAFWVNAAAILAWSLSILAVAAVILSRTWRDSHHSAGAESWRRRMGNWTRGGQVWRVALRRQLLDKNPFIWLAAQDRRSEAVAWSLVAGIAFLGLIGFLMWPPASQSVLQLFAMAILLNVSVGFVVVYAAGKRIGEDRRSGAIELLLTSPLSVKEIVDGQLDALRWQFRSLLWTLAAANLGLMLAGLGMRPWNIFAVATYLMAWVTLALWSAAGFRVAVLKAMWISLNSGRPTYALFRAASFSLVAFYGGYFALRQHTTFSRFPFGWEIETIFVGAIFLITLVVVAFDQTDRKIFNLLADEFRLVAQQPVPEPSDPRFKTWDTNQRFPIPRAGGI